MMPLTRRRPRWRVADAEAATAAKGPESAAGAEPLREATVRTPQVSTAPRPAWLAAHMRGRPHVALLAAPIFQLPAHQFWGDRLQVRRQSHIGLEGKGYNICAYADSANP